MTNDCKTCPVSTGTHKPAEALQHISEPQTQQPDALRLLQEYRKTMPSEVLHLWANDACDAMFQQHARIAELEGQLAAIGAGGVEPLRKQAAAAPQAAQGMDMVNCKSGNWLTVVYRDIRPGDEARTIGEHPKVSALSWSHALNDRDAALAAQAKQGE